MKYLHHVSTIYAYYNMYKVKILVILLNFIYILLSMHWNRDDKSRENTRVYMWYVYIFVYINLCVGYNRYIKSVKHKIFCLNDKNLIIHFSNLKSTEPSQNKAWHTSLAYTWVNTLYHITSNNIHYCYSYTWCRHLQYSGNRNNCSSFVY